MNYLDELKTIIDKIPKEFIDFSSPHLPNRVPTQASSNFITNKEQGDWAESIVLKAINNLNDKMVAVKYGKSDDIIAGDPKFNMFYEEFQSELDSIGKRPDILIFRREDYRREYGLDISKMNQFEINSYVRKAIAGIEVRSSSFLIDKYEETTKSKKSEAIRNLNAIRNTILEKFTTELSITGRKEYLVFLKNFQIEDCSIISFKVPKWQTNSKLLELSDLFKQFKFYLKEIQKREFLSITPKVEDIKVVYKWIETFGVPHFYFQVFFDKIFSISFKTILEIISDETNEGRIFFIEKDLKNQNKTTIKIDTKNALPISTKVIEPDHTSRRKELERGRLLFYVHFSGGLAQIDKETINNILIR
ncbi:MAG TPA: AccI family restriction endonuclease [Melioribacteraceae bacterium]|nr:AccI family restriction endonuclease [Melioribacteraceae bacterium]